MFPDKLHTFQEHPLPLFRSRRAHQFCSLFPQFFIAGKDRCQKCTGKRCSRSSESVPDIVNCDALAQLYNVELNDLIHHDQEQTGLNVPPKGKHIFGTVRVGERGQIVLPKQAREVFRIKPGDQLVILGDESLEHPGIALMKEEFFLGIAQLFNTALNIADVPDEKERK